MKKWIARIACVILIFATLYGVDRLVRPKYTTGIIEGGFTAEYYREENPHQVLMVGDCEVYETYSPITLWKNYGITSYIRGSAQQLIWQSYYMLKDALKYETPDVVVFNVQALMHNEPQQEEYNRMTIDGMRPSVEKYMSAQASLTEDEHFIDYVFPVLRYHDRIFKLKDYDFEYYFNDIQRTTAGYYMRVDEMPYEEGIWDEEKPSDEELVFGENAMNYMDKIRQLCDEKGIKLLLVKAPSVYPFWYQEYEDLVLEYAKKYDLDYINYLDLVDEIGISYETDTYDEGLHMNLSGAEKCADYLGRFLSEKYELQSQASDPVIAADWRKKEEFYEQRKANQYAELEQYGRVKTY